MEGKYILIASSVVVLQYRKYVVKKTSLFNVTLVNYANKCKKTVKKMKMAKINQF